MADLETEQEWAKSKRIEAEKLKAARDLETRVEDKSGLAYLPVTKTHGFSRDPSAITKSAERLANVSIVFTLLGIVFGIFSQVFAVVALANQLGLAGGGIAMILGAVHSIGFGVGVLTGVVALGCSIAVFRRATCSLKPAIITASISLALIAVYYIISSMIS